MFDENNLKFIVMELGKNQTREEISQRFAILSENPHVAACYLVEQLRPIGVKKLSPGEERQRVNEFHVIWVLRALRYLSSCKDFRVPTAESFRKDEVGDEIRSQFLNREQSGIVPFFAVWMSRDIIFVASRDAQLQVISRWKQWLYESTSDSFKGCSDFNAWYQ